MRHASFLPVMACLPLLCSCGTPWPLTYPVTAYVGVDLASVAVLGRSLGDVLVSGVSGRDCSVVRLEEGKSYCRPIEPPPLPPEFCTRSLARADCWSNPEALNDHPVHGIADGPTVLTPAQEANRTRQWP